MSILAQLVVRGGSESEAVEAFRVHLMIALWAYKLLELDDSDATCRRVLTWLRNESA